MEDPRRTRAIRASLVVAILLLVVKWYAYWRTHSLSILSDAAESVIHLVATGVAAFSLWYSSQPADDHHLYGHGRIAYFSAGIEGGLVLFAALAILAQAVLSMIHGGAPHQLEEGIVLTAAVAGVNTWLGFHLVRVGKQSNSVVLIANGHHVLSDVWTSVGALVGLGLVRITGIAFFDPAFAAVLGVLLGVNGIRLVIRSYHGLMDRVDVEVARALVESLDRSVAEGLISEYHELRHRTVEGEVWVEVHLLLDGEMSVREAHDHVSLVEDRLDEALGGRKARITSHVEPYEQESWKAVPGEAR